MTTYPKCFVATDLTQLLIQKGYASNETEAVEIGEELVDNLLIVHVKRDHTFKNEHLFFQFMADERDPGHFLTKD